jgi:hypothetical protein
VQTLAEFMRTTQKLAISPRTAMGYGQAFAASWPVLNLTPQVVLEPLRGVSDHMLSDYDDAEFDVAAVENLAISPSVIACRQ